MEDKLLDNDGMNERFCDNMTEKKDIDNEEMLNDITLGKSDKETLNSEVNGNSTNVGKEILHNLHSLNNDIELNAISADNVKDKKILLNDYNVAVSIKSSSKKYSTILDSDTDDEDISIPSLRQNLLEVKDDIMPNIPDSEITSIKMLKDDSILKVSNDNNTDDETCQLINKSTKKVLNKLKTLVDSESEPEPEPEPESEENYEDNCTFAEKDTVNIPTEKNKIKKSRTNQKSSIRASKDEAMKKIHSETQRLLRESNFSLPYHKPKQRTLKEFLNRKNLAPVLPKALTTAAKLKMSFEIVSEVLEKKQKEAELFYKSSDSEEETDSCTSMDEEKHQNELCIENEGSSKDSNEVEVENVQNFITNNNEEFCNKEIIRQKSEIVTENELNTYNENQNEKMEESKGNFKKDMERELNDCNNFIINKGCTMVNNDCDKFENDNIEQTIDKVIQSLERTTQNMDNAINTSISLQNNFHDTIEILESGLNSDVTSVTSVNEQQDCQKDETSQINNTNVKAVVCEEEYVDVEKQRLVVQEDNERDGVRQEVSNDISEKEIDIPEGHVQGLPLPNFINDEKEIMIRKKISQNKVISKPHLKGSPGMVIDLTDNMKPNKKGINTLLNRFFQKHTVNLKSSESICEVSVVHVDEIVTGPRVTKHILPYKLPVNENKNSELNKPGAKLLLLKEDLKLKMAIKRNEEWKLKEVEVKKQEEILEDDEDSVEYLEKTKYVSDETSGESEPEENDVRIVEKKKKSRCQFVDEEAEVSEDEAGRESSDELDNDSEIDTEHETEDETEELEQCKEKECYDDDSEDEEISFTKKKEQCKSKDIINDFEDKSNLTNDIDAHNEISLSTNEVSVKNVTNVNTLKTSNGYENCTSDVENDIPVFQNQKQSDVNNSQACKTPLSKSNIFNLVSPVTQLSVLNARSNCNEKDSIKENQFSFINDNSLSMKNTSCTKSSMNCKSEIGEEASSQKNLFDNHMEITTDEDLMQLCSGSFLSVQKTTDTDLDKFDPSFSQCSISTSQLLGLRSEPTKKQLLDWNDLENNAALSKDDAFHNTETLSNEQNNVLEKRIIKGTNEKSTASAAPWIKLSIDDSTDEEDELRERKDIKRTKKRKAKKLEFSDNEENYSSSETIFNEDEESEKYIDYDSEENEVVVIPKNDIKKVAAKFLEEEAELTESDWDSADEDEKGLDKYEVEEADDENIDEGEMKDQLEKMHVKQVLDQDQREVRMLKELLFEDGDLYADGAGRERKFRWRNIDKSGDNDEKSETMDEQDGWLDVQENEDELKWRKLRHEREKFLEERKKVANDEDDLDNNEILKLGIKALKKIEGIQCQKQSSLSNAVHSNKPIIPRNISDLLSISRLDERTDAVKNIMRKRSLLARGEKELNRIAQRVKQTDKVSLAPANTRHFVFAHVESSIKENHDENKETHEEDSNMEVNLNRKRKATKNVITEVAKRVKKSESTKDRKT